MSKNYNPNPTKKITTYDNDPTGSIYRVHGGDPTKIYRAPTFQLGSAQYQNTHEAWDTRTQNFYRESVKRENEILRRHPGRPPKYRAGPEGTRFMDYSRSPTVAHQKNYLAAGAFSFRGAFASGLNGTGNSAYGTQRRSSAQKTSSYVGSRQRASSQIQSSVLKGARLHSGNPVHPSSSPSSLSRATRRQPTVFKTATYSPKKYNTYSYYQSNLKWGL